MCIITDYFENIKRIVVPIGICPSMRISVKAMQQESQILRSCGRFLQPTPLSLVLFFSVAVAGAVFSWILVLLASMLSLCGETVLLGRK